MRLPDSRCGLRCTGCGWKDACGCGGCIETMGHPFHGECPIALCCQQKGYTHCGACDIMPCEQLYTYSYLDPEHGDKPPGARVEVCRRWAAENGLQAWTNVLLTSAGFADFDGTPKPRIIDRFLRMLEKPAAQARVLFVTTAANDDFTKQIAAWGRRDLVNIGIPAENIDAYDIDGHMTLERAMRYDVIYFTGGDTDYLLRRVNETGFDAIVKKMVYANKVYVGVSAGSLIATPFDRAVPYRKDKAGLCFIHTFLSVHYLSADAPEGSPAPLPHISITDDQALAVSWAGYEVLEG